MKKYEFFPHTADVKYKAYGKTLEEAFSNAALALTKVITEDKINAKVEKKISVESEDKKALLYDFLEQFIVLLDSEDFLLSKINKMNIEEKEGNLKLDAVVSGDKGTEKYNTETHIKAATYQEMEIEEKKGKVMVQVVLDI